MTKGKMILGIIGVILICFFVYGIVKFILATMLYITILVAVSVICSTFYKCYQLYIRNMAKLKTLKPTKKHGESRNEPIGGFKKIGAIPGQSFP
jgi:hypothetical protein